MAFSTMAYVGYQREQEIDRSRPTPQIYSRPNLEDQSRFAVARYISKEGW